VTTEAAQSVGWTVAVEAAEYTWDGLAKAIVEQVAKERR
jgi:uroporphyrinogen-III synthase